MSKNHIAHVRSVCTRRPNVPQRGGTDPLQVGDIKTNAVLIRKILSTEPSSPLPSSRPTMTSNPAIIYSGDVLPRGRLFASWEQTRHSKPVHWFIECFAESVSRNNDSMRGMGMSYRYLQMGVFLYTWAGMKRY